MDSRSAPLGCRDGLEHGMGRESSATMNLGSIPPSAAGGLLAPVLPFHPGVGKMKIM